MCIDQNDNSRISCEYSIEILIVHVNTSHPCNAYAFIYTKHLLRLQQLNPNAATALNN